MFDLRKFVLNGLLGAVGDMEDFRIKLNAAGWYEKGVLSEEDMVRIESAIEARNEQIVPIEEVEA